MHGRNTENVIFIRRMQESYFEKNRKLFSCFVDLDKAFDQVPMKVIERVLRKKLVPERLVQAVMSMYKGEKTRVQVGGGHSKGFDVSVRIGSFAVFVFNSARYIV